MKGVRLKALGVALLGALALIFAGCGQQGGGSTQAPKGSLTVNVAPADAQVQVTGPGGYSQSFTGGKTLTDLNPGSYTVQATKTGYFPAQATHQVEAGKTTTVVLNLLPQPTAGPNEGKVAVLVVNGSGAPISGATVSDGTNTQSTDAQGRADLTYTAAGTYAISVNKSGYLGDGPAGQRGAGQGGGPHLHPPAPAHSSHHGHPGGPRLRGGHRPDPLRRQRQLRPEPRASAPAAASSPPPPPPAPTP